MTKIFQIGSSVLKGGCNFYHQYMDSMGVGQNADFEFRLVENPIVLSFRELIQKYDQITTPITLVCAGNRRKEQNTVRKSKGFSWGAAGLSTALWTGPLMADVLRSAKPLRRAKYVCMEGADKLVIQPAVKGVLNLTADG